MAIVIEREKRIINWPLVLGFLIVATIIVSGVYYLFFVNPAQVEVFIPVKLKSLSDFKQIDFNPSRLINNQEFQSLKRWAEFNPPASESVGRSNPFIP